MVKNSFTLFETLLSITILTIVISGFYNSTYYDNSNLKNYIILNDLENSFNTHDYKNFNISSKSVKVTVNNNNEEFVNFKVYSYEDENIKVYKYEK